MSELLQAALAAFDIEDTISVTVAAEPAHVYAALVAFEPGEDVALRAAFCLHDAPARLCADNKNEARSLSRPGPLERWAMATRPPDNRHGGELLLGFVGKFWWPFSPIAMPALQAFRDGRAAAATRVAWGFTVRACGAHKTTLACTLRAASNSARARAAFGTYWRLVRPVSNQVRRRLVMRIKAAAEAH